MIGLGLSIAKVAVLQRLLTSAAPIAVAVGEGDSITASNAANGDPNSYFRLWAAGVTGRTINNFAVGGSTLSSMAARSAAVTAANPGLLYVLIGANDLSSDTSAYLTQLWAYTDPYRNAGAKVIVGTVLPRGAGAVNWEAKRGPYNAALRAAVGVKIDDIVDFDTSPMGAVDAYQNTAWFDPDGLHPNAAGHALLRRTFAPVMNHWLGIANEPLDFAFAAQAAAIPDTDYDSAAYTVKGLYPGETRPYSVSIGGKISKNGGPFVTNGTGTVALNDTIQLRGRSSADPAAQVDTSATIGTTTATYSVTTAGAGSRDWVPTDLGSKLKLWLQPEAISGANASQMDSWPDSSGNDIAVNGFGYGSKPTVAANALNGFKAAKTVSGYNQAGFSLPAGYLTGRTSGAAFFVSKLDADPPTGDGVSPIRDFGTDFSGEFYPYVNRNVYSSYGSTTRNQTPELPVNLAAWRLASFHAGANDWRYYVDGTNVHTLTSNTFATGSNPALMGGNNRNFDGMIAEIIDCTSSLTTTERQLVEGYLAWKYGLQANLPDGHPFENEKPTI